MRTHCERITTVLQSYDLFYETDTGYRSKHADEHMKFRELKSQKASKSAGKRWNNANALRTHCDGNAIKVNKIKVNEIKEKEIKENNKDNDIDEIYLKYPSTDKNNDNRPTGKGSKDKEKIKALLKKHTKEELISTIGNYIEASNNSKSYIKNFSVFLNNLPEKIEIIKPEPERFLGQYERLN